MTTTKECQSVEEMVDSLLETADNLLNVAVLLAKIHEVPTEGKDLLKQLLELHEKKNEPVWTPWTQTNTGGTTTSFPSVTTFSMGGGGGGRWQ